MPFEYYTNTDDDEEPPEYDIDRVPDPEEFGLKSAEEYVEEYDEL